MEWVAVVALVAALLAGGGLLAPRVVGAAARVAPRAAVRAGAPVDPLDAAYGPATAALVRRVAPGLVYARGSRSVPVDPRRCRARACADAPARPGPVTGAATGEPVTLFVHVVRRAGAVYVQLWAYYPDSAWSRPARALGLPCGCHEDDWEGVQLRIRGARVEARATAHRGYTGRRIGPDLNLNQVRPSTGAWTAATGWLHVAAGSHAGHLVRGVGGRRFTPAAAIRLVALEPAAASLPQGYAVTPPWRKRVWTDPEAVTTG